MPFEATCTPPSHSRLTITIPPRPRPRDLEPNSTSPNERPRQRQCLCDGDHMNHVHDADNDDDHSQQNGSRGSSAELLNWINDGNPIAGGLRRAGNQPRAPGPLVAVGEGQGGGGAVPVCPRGANRARRGLRAAPATSLNSDDEQDGDEALEEEFCQQLEDNENRSPAEEDQSDPVPEKQSLPARAYHLVLSIVMVCDQIVAHSDDSSYVSEILDTLQGGSKFADPIPSVMAVDSLENLATRCILSESTAACIDFVYMLSCIQLRCKVIRSVIWNIHKSLLIYFSSCCTSTGQKQLTILKSIKTNPKRSYRTLARYVQDGAKFCLLAGGGTLFNDVFLLPFLQKT